MSLPAFAVRRPITTMMLVLSVVVIGAISLRLIPLEYLPEISSRHLRVRVSYPSSSPRECERLITRPLEEAMGTVKGVEALYGDSDSNGGGVTWQFGNDVNMDLAAMEVRDRIDRVRPELPDDVERINIWRWQTTDLPVVEIAMSSVYGKAALQEAVENVIRRRLERLEGVANVDVWGLEERQLLAELDLARMKACGVEPFNIRAALRNNNITMSAGNITDAGRRYVVRIMGELQKPEDLERLPLKRGKVRLGDVADVRYDFPDKTSYQLVDGREAVGLRVFKSSGANLVAVSRRVQAELEKLKSEPSIAGIRMYVYRDRSKDILKSLNSLKNAGLSGGVLVMIILYFFLRSVRSTLIVSAAIPLSVMFAIGLMFLAIRLLGSSITINIVSLSGLMLSLGMLVDPAVVVLENVFRMREDHDLSARDAAVAGASQVGTAVLAATATTMCVFVPMMFFQSGRMRFFMKDFGMTICLVLSASLLVALTLVPLAASRVLVGKTHKKSWFVQMLIRLYHGVLSATLRFRMVTVFMALVLGVFSIYMYFHIEKSRRFGRGARRVRIRVDTPRTFELEDTRKVFDRLERALDPRRAELEIETISSRIQRNGGMLEVYLTEEDKAKRSTDVLKEEIKAALPSIAGVRYRAGRHYGMSGEQAGVSVDLKGPRTDAIERLAGLVRERLEKVPFVSDVDTSIENGREEIRAVIDRDRAQGFALTPLRVARGVMSALSSRAASRFKTRDKEVDIKVELREKDRVSLEQLKNLEFESGSKELVTFDQIASFTRVRGPNRLRRQDRQSVVNVTANTDRRHSGMARALIEKSMSKFPMPPGYSWSFGQSRWYRQEDSDTRFGLLLAAGLVYMIMASLFESFVHPFVIMFSIPFAFFGVAFGFHFTGTPVDHMSIIGILLLCGLVVNNAIVLIDHVNQLRREGVDRREALLKGGCDRLRPILMTTLTTILGLLPMVLPLLIAMTTKWVDGWQWLPSFVGQWYHAALAWAEVKLPSVFGPVEGRDRMYAPMCLALVAGLSTSTILTLVVMPSMYSLIDDVGQWVKRIFKTA